MFTRVESGPRPSAGEDTLVFEAQVVAFRPGDTVAAALLAAGISSFRENPVDGSPRAPYCLMGVCYECLVEIDGRQNQQSCLVRARAGMIVKRQRGARMLA